MLTGDYDDARCQPLHMDVSSRTGPRGFKCQVVVKRGKARQVHGSWHTHFLGQQHEAVDALVG